MVRALKERSDPERTSNANGARKRARHSVDLQPNGTFGRR